MSTGVRDRSSQFASILMPLVIAGLTATPAGAQSVTAGAQNSASSWQLGASTWGENNHGELGDGTLTSRPVPGPLSVANVVAVAAGEHHVLFLDSGGQVWSAGHNSNGQLGLGDDPDPPGPFTMPRPVVGLSGIVQIAAGALHSLALAQDGTVYAWGANGNGQLGDGSTTARATPVAVFTGAVAIAGGTFHSLAVASDGTVRAWGDNNFHQLGDGTSTDRSTPVAVLGLNTAVSVAAGDLHSLFLLSDGSVLAVGYNAQGQRGPNGGNPTQPVTVDGVSSICQVAAACFIPSPVAATGRCGPGVATRWVNWATARPPAGARRPRCRASPRSR